MKRRIKNIFAELSQVPRVFVTLGTEFKYNGLSYFISVRMIEVFLYILLFYYYIIHGYYREMILCFEKCTFKNYT